MSQNLATADRARDDRDVNKDLSIKLRVTAAEHAAWVKAADSEGESLSNWIRRRCNGLPATAPTLKPTKKAKRP